MLMPEREKKHCMAVNAIKENTRDRDAVRRALRCALKALPASSPSTPKRRLKTGDFFLCFSCSSPVFLMASRGVSRLSFRAGIQAEIHMVARVRSSVTRKTNGW